MSGSRQAARWVVSGRVQGVGFRWFILNRARRLELVGWVSNLADGRVEVVAMGPSEAVLAMDAMVREGPEMAHVENVEKNDIPHEMLTVKTFNMR